MKDLLDAVGIEPDRLALVWVSAAEGPRFAAGMTGFIETIRSLGPLGMSLKDRNAGFLASEMEDTGEPGGRRVALSS